MGNYSTCIQLNANGALVFSALTLEIPLWWTQMFEGRSNRESDQFTVRFGHQVYKKMRVDTLIQNSKVVWYVVDSRIEIPGLVNQKEWIGTTIIWEIAEREHGTELQLTHIGLDPNTECYSICTKGWVQFIDSLKLYLETGSGAPFVHA